MFQKKDIVDTFPNVEIMLKMYLSMTVTYCSGEGSFSKLKLIQTRLRSRMGNQRLNQNKLTAVYKA